MKPRFDVKVDCYSNGVGVSIKDLKTKKFIGSRVFQGKRNTKLYPDWIKRIVKETEKPSQTTGNVKEEK